MMVNIIGKRFWYFLIAALIILVCVIFLGASGLKFGIEFSSGSILTVSFSQSVSQDDLKQELANIGYPNVITQKTTTGDFLLRMPELTSESRTAVETTLTSRFGGQVKEYNTISPLIAAETTENAAIAVAVAIIGILLYIIWAFRHMPRPFHYGVCAIIALIHDTVLAMGVFAILGFLFGWEVNMMFIVGILAVIGYSVNNTVVVFDRIRENVKKGVSADFEVTVNNSVIETLGRCLNTNLTTLLTILALFLFVGSTIQNFVVVMMVGIIAGTYDSSFIAPALLVSWHKGDWGYPFRRLPQQTSQR